MQDKIMHFIEEFEARLQTLKDEYEEDKAECEFEEGDIFWSILKDGQDMEFEWRADKYYVACYEQGNVFKTREEAKFEVEKRKVLHELKQLGRPFKPHEDNYAIAFSHIGGFKIVGYITTVSSYGNYYFDSTEEAKKAIDKIGEDRIKKYLFGIDEE